MYLSLSILNNVNIKQVLCHKHLGPFFNDTMTLSDHTDGTCRLSKSYVSQLL
jgi:hypothetical protein